MSGVVLLLIGTGTLSGIISNSELTDVIVNLIEYFGLPGYLLAPISGVLMGVLQHHLQLEQLLGCQIFGPVVLESGIAPLGVQMTARHTLEVLYLTVYHMVPSSMLVLEL